MSRPHSDEDGWRFAAHSGEGAFAAEVDRALEAHRAALDILLDRRTRIDLQLAGFLEDIGNRYLDLSEIVAEVAAARSEVE